MAEALLNQSLTEQKQEEQREGDEGRREEEEERRPDEGGEAREEGRGAAREEEKQKELRGREEEEREAVGRENQEDESKVQREAEQSDEGREGEKEEGEAGEEERQPNEGRKAEEEEERQPNKGREVGEEERQPNEGREAGVEEEKIEAGKEKEERQPDEGREPGGEEERQPEERREEQGQEGQAEERRVEQGQGQAEERREEQEQGQAEERREEQGQGQAEERREEQGQEGQAEERREEQGQEQAEERREEQGQGQAEERREEQGQGQAEERREEQGQGQGEERREELGQGQAEERREEQGQGQAEERRGDQGQGQAEERREGQGQGQAEERREEQGQGQAEERIEQGQEGQLDGRREQRQGQVEERREGQGQQGQPNEDRRGAQEEERAAEEGEEIEFEDDDNDDEEEEEREAENGREQEEELQPQQQNRGEERLVGGGGVVDNRGGVGAVGVVGAGPGQILERQDQMQWREELKRTQVARLTGKDWWQCHLATVKQRMATLHHQNRLFDVILIFPKYQVEMKTHKLVLAMSSPVLEAMLYGPMSQVADGHPHHLTLAEDLPETFEWLLRYVYRDETKFQGTIQALSVYEAAHKYQMDSLARLCSQYLADSVTPDNFPYVFDPAVLYDDTELLNRCYEVAMVQGREVLSCPDLCVLRRPALRALLTIPRLHVDKESYLFRALVQWGWYHLDEGPPLPAKPCPDMLPVRRRLRAVIDEFLPYVRFLAMSLNEFVTEVEGSQLLSPDECMAVVRAMRGTAPAAVLPHFISANDTRRRRGLVTVAVLVSPPSNETLSFEYMEVLSINLMQNLTVSAALHLVRLASTGVCSLREGSVVVWDESGDHVARGVWSGNGCLFRRPVSLAVGRRYSAVLTLKEAWCVLTTTAINVTHKRIVFRGQTQCGGILRLEYMSGTFLPVPSLQRPFPAAVYIIDP